MPCQRHGSSTTLACQNTTLTRPPPGKTGGLPENGGWKVKRRLVVIFVDVDGWWLRAPKKWGNGKTSCWNVDGRGSPTEPWDGENIQWNNRHVRLFSTISQKLRRANDEQFLARNATQVYPHKGWKISCFFVRAELNRTWQPSCSGSFFSTLGPVKTPGAKKSST